MTQQVLLGRGVIRELGNIDIVKQAKRVFVVSGKASYVASGAKSAIEAALGAAIVDTFVDYTANPCIEEVMNGVQRFKIAKADLIVAVGGGSAMDVAKSINGLAQFDARDVPRVLAGKIKIEKVAAPMVAIPTTAGTGSEATHFAVVYMQNKKYSLAAQSLLPACALVDPQFSQSATKYVLTCCALDALSQAIESLWAVNSTEESRGYSTRAIQDLMANIKPAVVGDAHALDKVSEAAFYAGKAINIAKTTAAHALSYSITSEFNVPHGHAVALTLGRFFVVNSNADIAPAIDPRGESYVTEIMQKLYGLLGCRDGADALLIWKKLLRDLGVASELAEVGITNDKDKQKIVGQVNLERLGNHPVKLEPEIIIRHVMQ